MKRIDRRIFIFLSATGSCAAVNSFRDTFAQAVESTADPPDALEIDRAVRRGLAFLVSRQNEDGSFGTGAYSRNVAVCGLAGLALMSGGSVPARGKYGRPLRRCVDFILEHSEASGFITNPSSVSHGPMYGHGFATLFLAEAYGSLRTIRLRDVLRDATRLIVNSQNDEGGWRYHPRRNDADVSVTVCQVMALRAARNSGFYVPNDTISRSIAYIRRNQNEDGGFMYMARDEPSEFGRSAAAIVALHSAGIYEGDEIDRGREYLLRYLPGPDSKSKINHFYYSHYYGVQAMWHAGGEYWNQWYPAVVAMLLDLQDKERGSWADGISAEYGTAMATIVLQMPNNYLPSFQR